MLQNIRIIHAGIAQLVEHNLAKVGVASSSLVSRSRTFNFSCNAVKQHYLAGWQSGYAAACKAVDVGSIPASALELKLVRACLCSIARPNLPTLAIRW
ncbi:hypothetical protein CCP3SC5AM1_190006 [Gammaproteobacteria bacterium]